MGSFKHARRLLAPGAEQRLPAEGSTISRR
jgi:hypothetical protein